MSEQNVMNGTKCSKDGWVKKKLGEVCSSELGKTLNKSKDTGELFPYLCAVNVFWDKIDLTNLKETKFKLSEIERYKVKKGDLLICEGGDIGRAAIWNRNETILYQNALHRVRFNDDMDPRFFLYYLFYLKKEGILDNTYGKGVTIKHLVKSALLSIPISVAPFIEQQHIVSELDCLNGIIEKQKEQLKQLDELAQSIFYDMFGDPVENEKGWEVKKIGDISVSELGKTLNKSKDIGICQPYLCAINVMWNHIDLTTLKKTKFKDSEKKRYSVNKGDLLICEGGDIGRAAIWNHDESILYQNALHRVRFSHKIMPVFCLYFLWCLKNNGTLDTKYGKGVTIKHLVKSSLVSIPIIVPPLSLQQSFAQKIEAIEHQKELIKKSLAETETLFNSRMDYYFS